MNYNDENVPFTRITSSALSPRADYYPTTRR